jgi:hypothetical protein
MSGFDTKMAEFVASNPGLNIDEAKITLTVRELKRLLRKFYNAGEETIVPIGEKMSDIIRAFGDATR